MSRTTAYAGFPNIVLDGPMLSRKCACGAGKAAAAAECDSCGRKLQRRARPGAAGHEVPSSVEGVLRSAGEPLGAATLRDMESRFGRSFAHVRLHRDGDAAASAESVGALAYTVGQHVVFGAAQYAPHTASGRQLLAHELAHVLQQTHGASRAALGAPRLAPAAAERAIEANADRVAAAALGVDRGVSVEPVQSASVIARQAAPASAPASAPAAAPATACTSAANVTQANLGRTPGGRFDATLDRSTCPWCSLGLTMRVFFQQANAWSSASSWNAFQADYVRLVQDRWSHVYDFIPPAAGCSGEGCQRVSVGLNVVPVAAAGSPHWTINVQHTDQVSQSFVSPGAHTATLHSSDTSSNGSQVVAEHEAGHMLGFGHTDCGLNGAYTGDVNAASCYGSDDIMGAGTEVTVPEYQVFSETLATLAPGCAWRPAITDARRSRNRTAGGVLGGILGGLAAGGLGFAAGQAIASALGGNALLGGLIGGGIGLAAGAIGGAFAGSAIGNASRRTGEV
jgi:hypothetical protein